MPEGAVELTFKEAIRLHRAGRLQDAEQLYRQILMSDADHAGAIHLLGVAALASGRPAEAIDHNRRAVALSPENAIYQISLGHTFSALGQHGQAVAAYRRATELSPELAEAWLALGNAWLTTGQHSKAIGAYRRVLAIQPEHVDACNNLGSALEQSGDFEQAVAVYRRALALQPQRSMTLNNLASALLRCGRLDEAIACCRQAIQYEPDFAAAYNNLGLALTQSRRLDKAVSSLRRAVETCPDFAQAWYNLGNALHKSADLAEAAVAYRRALDLKPDWVEAWINLGNTLQALREFEYAADSYRRALGVRPDDVNALNNLGSVYRDLGLIDEAISSFRRCIALRRDFPVAYCNLGNALRDSGRIDEAITSYRRAIELCPTDVISDSNLAYAVHFHPDYDGAAILRENLAWNARHAAALANVGHQHPNDRDPERRLRIGYIGADFRDHCQSLFTIPLLSHHDHQQFEITCYANLPQPDAVTRRIMGSADRWRVIAGQSDQEVADQVRADQIDLLIDLTMHMSNGRPLVLARKPAPVQVAYLAYPGTTGLSAIDYRLTDPYLDPPGQTDGDYAEKSFRLPETFWCYDPLTASPSPGPLPAIGTGRITFGCLNNFSKVNAPTLALWTKVLRAVPDSRLMLLSPPGDHRQSLIEHLGRAAIEAGRVEFVEYRPRLQYLELYRQIDIGLDTIPYNGHTTSLDSLWMGVPVVTRVGLTAVGRAGLSQLSNLGLMELVAKSNEEFTAIARALAGDLPRLSQLRSSLRGRMEASPLMDAPRFARNIESAFRQMWRAWCAGG